MSRSLDWKENRVLAPIRVMELSAKVSSAIEAAAVVIFDFSPILSLVLAGCAPAPSSFSTMFFNVVTSASFSSTPHTVPMARN